MGRMLPTECEHGITVDWGDFGPEEGDHCVECDAHRTVVIPLDQWQRIAAVVRAEVALRRAIRVGVKPTFTPLREAMQALTVDDIEAVQ